MNDSFEQLILTELYTARIYLERLFLISTERTSLVDSPELREITLKFHFDLENFIQDSFIKSSVLQETSLGSHTSLSQSKKFILESFKVLESLTQLNLLSSEALVEHVCDFINLCYNYSHALHNLILDSHPDLEIQLPREVTLSSEIVEDLPLFFLSKDYLKNIAQNNSDAPLVSLNLQRKKKYRDLLIQGHEYMAQSKIDVAIGLFEKAQSYDETPEVLNALAWAHSSKGKYEISKKLCLKAIKIDPEYGPAYNDLGSYLLGEGLPDESLKWFHKAKKCQRFHNREYAFINSGRAFMHKKDYKKALKEFSFALTLAPDNQELHQTVERLKRALDKSIWSNQSENETAKEEDVFSKEDPNNNPDLTT